MKILTVSIAAYNVEKYEASGMIVGKPASF